VHDLLSTTLTEGLYLALRLSLPVLGVAFVVSAVMGLLQATTQLLEPTLSAVPRALSVGVTLAFAGAWMGAELSDFARRVLEALPQLVR
jgi:flagellar biosynthetic protein FliQ